MPRVAPRSRLTVNAAVDKLFESRQTVHAILSERSSMRPQVVVRLGKLRGDGPEIRLRIRMAHDLWQAKRHRAETVKRISAPQAVTDRRCAGA